MATVQEHYGLHQSAVLNAFKPTDFVVGCEFEIEDIKNIGNIPEDIEVANDHSLRNNGKEFKTPPVNKERAVELFCRLQNGLTLGKEPFSERTSIHVHVNARNLELGQLRQLILTYALFEPLYFDYVGDARKNSIFCVPLNYTYIPNNYKLDVPQLRQKWHKYTAFNITPLNGDGAQGISALGTVEFRHLYGTRDKSVFVTWLTAIEDLFNFIVKNPEFNITKTLLTGVDVVELAREVVPTLAKPLSSAVIRELCADTLLDVKLSAGGLAK
jgi:hypothetical protein